MNGTRIYQIYYREPQKAELDPAFEPYDNAGELSPLLELAVFRKLAAQPETAKLAYWGAMSWKFGDKTGLKGEALLEIMRANPGFDAYFCNPHPDTEALYHNLWLQGETSHPHFVMLAREVFAAAGLEASWIARMWPSALFAAANYFVATPAFWADYLEFVNGVLDALPGKLSKFGAAVLTSSMADARGAHANATYVPFLVERLFAVFLLARPGKYRAFKYLTARSTLAENAHLRQLREMKDEAIRTRSQWLASCWEHYRRLYLTYAYGTPWMKKYYTAITPPRLAYLAAPSGLVYPIDSTAAPAVATA